LDESEFYRLATATFATDVWIDELEAAAKSFSRVVDDSAAQIGCVVWINIERHVVNVKLDVKWFWLINELYRVAMTTAAAVLHADLDSCSVPTTNDLVSILTMGFWC
jgi:hypothetical protein